MSYLKDILKLLQHLPKNQEFIDFPLNFTRLINSLTAPRYRTLARLYCDFITLSTSEYTFNKHFCMSAEDLMNSNTSKSITWKFRFLFLLHIVLQSKNQRNNSGLSTIWYMLNYRGLSYSGIHLLHEFGICPSVNTVKVSGKDITQQFQAPLLCRV